jgi:cytochrome c5
MTCVSSPPVIPGEAQRRPGIQFSRPKSSSWIPARAFGLAGMMEEALDGFRVMVGLGTPMTQDDIRKNAVDNAYTTQKTLHQFA